MTSEFYIHIMLILIMQSNYHDWVTPNIQTIYVAFRSYSIKTVKGYAIRSYALRGTEVVDILRFPLIPQIGEFGWFVNFANVPSMWRVKDGEFSRIW